MRILNKINIKAKLILIYLLTISVIIFTVGGMFYMYSRNMTVVHIRDGTDDKMKNMVESIAMIERCIERACSYVATSEALSKMMKQEFDDDIMQINNQNKVSNELINIFGTIFDIQSISPYVHRLKFYINDELPFVKDGYLSSSDSTAQNGMVSAEAIKDEKWYKELSESKERIYVYDENSNEKYLFLAKQMYGRDNIFYGCCNIGLSINHILETNPNMKAAIINEEGEVLYNSIEAEGIGSLEKIQQELQKKSYDEILIYKNPMDGEAYYVNAAYTDNGIKIIAAVSAKEENEQLGALMMTMVILSLFLLFLGMVVFYFVSNKFTNPLKRLADIMGMGDVDAEIPEIPAFNENDEIGAIYRSVDILMHQVKETREADLRSFKKEKQMEIKMRQIQIGPHFLNNALNTLSCRAMLDGNDDIADYSAELAKILEYGLKNPEELVDLDTEILYLEKYVYLQNYAYEGAISMKVNIPERLKTFKVIKLILQPLVENSILHGFSKEITKVDIEINADETEENLIITVSDNGAGCDVVTLNNALLCGNSKGIGIKNIDERLKIHYGDGCGLSYRNDDGKTIAVLIMKKFIDETQN